MTPSNVMFAISGALFSQAWDATDAQQWWLAGGVMVLAIWSELPKE